MNWQNSPPDKESRHDAPRKETGGSKIPRKIPRSMRWFIWGVAALVALNLLLFWKFIMSSGSSSSTPKIQPMLRR